MTFAISEFVVEQILRNGLEEFRANPESLDFALEDIFGNFLTPLLSTKYGRDEIDKLRIVILNSQISIVHALPESADTKLPQISIHLQMDDEDEGLAFLGDSPCEDEIDIEPELIVDLFTATSYDPLTGIVKVPDLIDLSNVRWNRWYIDGNKVEHRVNTPISNESGNRYFTVQKGLDINLSDGKIVSAIDKRSFITNKIPCRESIMFGIHTQNSLFTKFLYHIVKHIVHKAGNNFREYNLELAKYRGSDFNQALSILPSQVYSRFLTMTFVAYNSWRQREIVVVDNISNTVIVEKDKYDREDNEDNTVQTD